jgi:hypothetical protein|tara:strand:- start:160 stop:312 length:153 start_codon:yes stop_codon:yes gene_type:complete
MIPKNRPTLVAVAGFFALGSAVVLIVFGGGTLFYLGYYAGKTTCPEAISN